MISLKPRKALLIAHLVSYKQRYLMHILAIFSAACYA